ncbi:Kinase-like protein [Mycena sanguinolenta]|uniref:Kinase-like protein n=1 Tax=Mycena sanguinolenta TaxID=230812 RepID=A0A8H6XC33_9AGAR|nr:Kinase-like protein [Mycena sanguinolenta]
MASKDESFTTIGHWGSPSPTAILRILDQDLIPKRILIYETVISCLKQVCTAGILCQCPDEIVQVQATLDEYRLSMASENAVSGIVQSLECRKILLELSSNLGLANDPSLRVALREDDKRIAALLVFIFTSKSLEEDALRLEGDPAQHFLDVVQSTLDKGFLIDQEHSRMARRMIRKLSVSCDMLPSSLFITGITMKERDPTFGGAYGDIYRASYENQIVALKYMRAIHFLRGSDLRRIRLRFCREALIWTQLHHPNILPCFGIDGDSFPSSLCMVSPWMDHGTVLNYLNEHGRDNADKLLYEIAQGLEYLHSCSIVHGDLRGANILINEDWSACLADFGLSIFSDSTSSLTSSRGGSVYRMAPELLDPDRSQDKFLRTPASDIYAFGCVCFELYTGRPPFANLPQGGAFMKILEGERPERPSGPPVMSNLLWQHVTTYWTDNPSARPATKMVVEHMAQHVPKLQPQTDNLCDSRPLKRQRTESHTPQADMDPISIDDDKSPSHSLLALDRPMPGQQRSATRQRKDASSEQPKIEHNWRTVRTLKGHTNGVMCLQFSETFSNPDFPVLITGSYDRTVRVWNLEAGVEIHRLEGHTHTVRGLAVRRRQADHGEYGPYAQSHTEGIVCLNFDLNVLVSGSVDSTIKVWNLRTGGVFTLRGHSDWVNSVQLWDSNPSARSTPSSLPSNDDASVGTASTSPVSQIVPGKMLFSASDDGTIKLWNLALRTCVRVFTGHLGQVQTINILPTECDASTDPNKKQTNNNNPTSQPKAELFHSSSNNEPDVGTNKLAASSSALIPSRKKPLLVSGSLDNTIKVWDIDTSETISTFFGHVEGVWAVVADKLHVVSGSHDRTIKVWSRDESKCTATLVGHRDAVTCVASGDDRIVSGSYDCDVKVWSFSG